MCKKVLVLGLVASMSAQAMYRGQELQVVVKTPVAQAIRWLSSGTPEANVAAGAIAASVVYSGMSLVTFPYRAWSNNRDRRMFAEQLSGMVDQVKENHEKLAMSVSRTAMGDGFPASVVTAEQLDEKTKQFEQKFAVITAALEVSKKQEAVITAALEVSKKQEMVLANRLVGVEQKAQQSVAQDGKSLVGSDEFTELKRQMATLIDSVHQSNQTRADKLTMFSQKVDALEGRISVNESQVKVLQDNTSRRAAQ